MSSTPDRLLATHLRPGQLEVETSEPLADELHQHLRALQR